MSGNEEEEATTEPVGEAGEADEVDESIEDESVEDDDATEGDDVEGHLFEGVRLGGLGRSHPTTITGNFVSNDTIVGFGAAGFDEISRRPGGQ